MAYNDYYGSMPTDFLLRPPAPADGLAVTPLPPTSGPAVARPTTTLPVTRPIIGGQQSDASRAMLNPATRASILASAAPGARSQMLSEEARAQADAKAKADREYAAANPTLSLPERLAAQRADWELKKAQITAQGGMAKTQAQIDAKKELAASAQAFTDARDAKTQAAAMERLKTSLGANADNLQAKLKQQADLAEKSGDQASALAYYKSMLTLNETAYKGTVTESVKEGVVPPKAGPPPNVPGPQKVSDSDYNMAVKYQGSPQYKQMTPAEQFRIDETVKAWQKQQRGV